VEVEAGKEPPSFTV